jgi:hypothetical protein
VNEETQLTNRANGPDLDLGALMARLRSQAASKRAAPAHQKPREIVTFNWPQVLADLTHAARLAPAPTAVPSLGRLRGLARWLARLIVGGFLTLAQVITVRQANLDGVLIRALRETAEGLRDLEKKLARQQERLDHLEAALLGRETRWAPAPTQDGTDISRTPQVA